MNADRSVVFVMGLTLGASAAACGGATQDNPGATDAAPQTDATTADVVVADAATPEDSEAGDGGADAQVPVSACDGGEAVQTDPRNCGRCGHDCMGGTCVQGTCSAGMVVATLQLEPNAIAVDSRYIYFTDASRDGAVCRIAVDAPATAYGDLPAFETLVTGQPNPQGIAVDGDAVYWTTSGYDSDAGTVMKAALDGGGATPLATGGQPSAIAVENGYVYWVQSGAIWKVPAGGGSPVVVASLAGIANMSQMVADPTGLYWEQSTAVPDPTTSALMHDNSDGGAPLQLAFADAGSTGVAVDGQNVYWTTDHGLFAVPRDGGASSAVYPPDGGSWAPCGPLALDDGGIYAAGSDGFLLELSRSGAVEERWQGCGDQMVTTPTAIVLLRGQQILRLTR